MKEILKPRRTEAEIIEFFDEIIDRSRVFMVNVGKIEANTRFQGCENSTIIFSEFLPFFANNIMRSKQKVIFNFNQKYDKSIEEYTFVCHYKGELYHNDNLYYLMDFPSVIRGTRKLLEVEPMIADKAYVRFRTGLRKANYKIEKISLENIYFKIPPSKLYNYRGKRLDFELMLNDEVFKSRGILDYDDEAKRYLFHDYTAAKGYDVVLGDYFEKYYGHEYISVSQDREIVLSTKKAKKNFLIILFCRDMKSKKRFGKMLTSITEYHMVSTSDIASVAVLAQENQADLILWDIDIPFMNSLSLIDDYQEIKKIANIPNIFVSGIDAEKLPKTLLSSADGWIDRASDADFVLDDLHRLLEKK